MSTPGIALVTAQAARDSDEDLPPLESALRNAGADVTIAEWDLPHDWRRFDAALLRSTWDYTQRLQDFLDWVDEVGGKTTLLNRPAVVKWNCDKHYLKDLAARGVPTVPSIFVEPGESAEQRIAELLSQPDIEEFVVKPAVGAGSRDAGRFERAESERAAAHAHGMLSERRSVLLQPYLSRVDEHGETALVLFNGEFSHAIRKSALLRRSEGPAKDLFVKERIMPRVPDEAELAVGSQVLRALPFDTPYMRAWT